MSKQLFTAFRLEQVQHVWPCCVCCHLCDDFLLVLSDQLCLESAENLEQFQVDRFFHLGERYFFSSVVDGPDELGHVECEEFGIVFENLIEQQSSNVERVHVSHEHIYIIIDFQLALKVVPDVRTKEPIAAFDQLFVLLAFACHSVDFVLDNLKATVSDVELGE